MFEDPIKFAQADIGFFSFIREVMSGRVPTRFYGKTGDLLDPPSAKEMVGDL